MVGDSSGTMDQKSSQVGITSFTDAQQSLFTSGGMLSWYQPNPGSQLTTVLEVAGITDHGNERGSSDQPNAWHFRQALAIGIVAVPGIDLILNLVDLFVEPFEVFKQLIN